MKDLSEHNAPTRTDCPSPTVPYVVLCEHPVAITNSKLVNAIMNGHVIHQQDVYGNVYATDWQFCRQNNYRFISRFIKRYCNLHGDIFGFVDITTGEYFEPVMYVPCGKCDLCRDKRRKQVAVMCQMECQMHDRLPIFVTLTYDNSTLPPDGLDYKDFQLFMNNLRNVYRDFKVPKSDWKPIRYCVCGEYGNDPKFSGRPHWHALIWDFPTYLFNHRSQDLDKYIREVWKSGITDTRNCYSGDTGYYIGKYIAKNEIPEGCVKKPFVRHSANLGVDFVKGVCQKIMTENPTFTDFKYKDKFTGHLKQLPLIMYYIKKMFPTINAVKPEVRDAVRCYNALCDISPIFEKFDIDPNLRKEITYGDYYTRLNLMDNTDVISRTLYLMAGLDGKIVPDYAKNRSIIDQYLNFLFIRLGDQDVAALAYNVKKKNANERCYRRDKKIKFQKYEY